MSGQERATREWAKDVVRAVPAVHIRNTDAVPTFKRRADACIDRAAVLLALEHEPPPAAPDPADLARWLQDIFEQQPAITIRRGVEPQVAWRALADELLRRWGG